MADRASMNEEELSRDLKHISQLLDLTAGSTGFILVKMGKPYQARKIRRTVHWISFAMAWRLSSMTVASRRTASPAA